MNLRVGVLPLYVCSVVLLVSACSTDPSKQVETPIFDPASGAYAEAQSMTISCETDGAEIYYTWDSSDPDKASILYEGAVTVDTTTTFKARAYKQGMDPSEIETAVYAITDVATPTFDPVAGTYTTVQNVTIACATPDVVIRFTTDGTNPTEISTTYTSAVVVDTTTTLKASAFRTGMTPSGVAEALFTIDFPDVEIPTFDPAPATYTADQQVNLACATADAAIYYTTDGSEPTESSTLYASAFTIARGTTTVRARAYKEFMDPSPIAEGAYVVDYPDVATPALDPTPGLYVTDQLVTITCATAGADVYYTTDSSEPTSGSTLYTAPFMVTTPTRVKARGYKAAMDSSAVTDGYYNINYPDVAAPEASPAGGIYVSSVTVSATCSTSGATIYYTTNGATPTESDAVWSGDLLASSTTTLKMRAFLPPAMDPSPVVTETYSIIPNLVAHYPFSGNANDASGNGHHGTVNGGISLVNDRFGTANSAYQFDGTDDYIQLADESAFDLTAFTISFRMKITDLPASEGPFTSNPGEWVVTAKGPTWGNFRVLLEHYGGASYGVMTYRHTSASGSYTHGGWVNEVNIYRNPWYHVVITVGSEIKTYVNGVLKLTDAAPTVPLTNNDAVLIGWASGAETNDYFTGTLDEIRFYSRALTAAEIQQLYNNGG